MLTACADPEVRLGVCVGVRRDSRPWLGSVPYFTPAYGGVAPSSSYVRVEVPAGTRWGDVVRMFASVDELWMSGFHPPPFELACPDGDR